MNRHVRRYAPNTNRCPWNSENTKKFIDSSAKTCQVDLIVESVSDAEYLMANQHARTS